MSTAKLYRVHVTQIREFDRISVSDCWIAAASRSEAVKRARNRIYITVGNPRLHFHVECHTGGTYHNKTTTLQPAMPVRV